MDERLLKRIFKNASPSFIQRNTQVSNQRLQNPEPELSVRDGAVEAPTGKAEGPQSSAASITITSYRTTLLDADNVCPKYLIDGLRYSRVIPEDSPKDVRLVTINQVQVDKESDERTEVEVSYCTQASTVL